MKDPSVKLVRLLRTGTISKEFRARTAELLEECLWPGWYRIAEPGSEETYPLTIAMATYDDFDGVYFSLQALRMYHPEILDRVEILVVDNNPQSESGKAVAKLVRGIDKARYVPFTSRAGTAVRDFVFRYARGRFVLCMDCHVLFRPGSLARLLNFIEKHPDCDDLLQGPIIFDDLKTSSSYWVNEWGSLCWGRWANDDEKYDADSEPFEILMQGLGVFCCRRQRWPGFDARLLGFGGEEGTLHQRFRNQGNRALCLPFLGWLHRFPRPLGVPYRNDVEERFRNYVLQFAGAGLDLGPLVEHFAAELSGEKVQQMQNDIEQEMCHPIFEFEALTIVAHDCPSFSTADLAGCGLFRRASLRHVGGSCELQDLSILEALRRSCGEALIQSLERWCVIVARGLNREELVARLELLTHTDIPGLWDGVGTLRLGPKLDLWKMNRAGGELLLAQVPATLEEMISLQRPRDKYAELAAVLKDQQA